MTLHPCFHPASLNSPPRSPTKPWGKQKLLPSRRVLCTPYNHAPYHFMQSHIRKVYTCLAVTSHLRCCRSNDRGLLCATAVTRGWNGYRNKTPEKKIIPPLQQGFEPATFRSRVRHSNHWAIPAPHTLSHTHEKRRDEEKRQNMRPLRCTEMKREETRSRTRK